MKPNQTTDVKKYLLAGNSLSSMQAFNLFGCTRLSDKIFRLKKAGYDIQKRMVTSKNRYGTRSTYAEYYINRS